MSMENIRLYLEGLCFIYNVDSIMNCIKDNKELIDNDINLEKIKYIAEHFGECILFEDGIFIDTSKYL